MPNSLKQILYAEDEPDIREIAKIALEDVGGFTVTFCQNGAEVMETVKTNKLKPDLVILDVMMPVMDGPMTLQELRKLPEFENIPIIFMTAKIQSNEITNYKSMGVIDVITKPFDPMTLSDKLRQIWETYKATV